MAAFPDRIQMNKGEETSEMIAKAHQVPHKDVLPGDKEKWQTKRITWHRDKGPGDLAQTTDRVPQGHLSSQQCALQ
jgi:hypothetical protein